MSHLDYYIRHNIAPVRYDLSNLEVHFQRREALYRTLGLLPLTIRGANVLEVAAGTGQNSLYIATLLPARLTLLEPNPAGIKNIRECYKSLSLPHTEPTLVECKLEDYESPEKFDIVICENWLGASPQERALLKKLAGFVAPRGILVITCVSPIGFLPNVVRRALAARLVDRHTEFKEQTRILVEAFAPHLATLGSMTRSVVDWVHDNMLNPAYFDLCLTIPMVIADLGQHVQAIAVSPDFRRDWRWFKAIHGAEFEFNHVLTEQYYRNCHNFLDYREIYDEQPVSENKTLEDAVASLADAIRRFDRADTQQSATGALAQVVAGIDRVRGLLSVPAPSAALALAEAMVLLERKSVSGEDVGQMRTFSGWFGRETMYLSLERMVDDPAVTSR